MCGTAEAVSFPRIVAAPPHTRLPSQTAFLKAPVSPKAGETRTSLAVSRTSRPHSEGKIPLGTADKMLGLQLLQVEQRVHVGGDGNRLRGELFGGRGSGRGHA